MKYSNFNEYVDNFSSFGNRTANVIKPFIKIRRQTYSDFQKNIYKTANYLISQKVKKGDRIMVMAGNSPQWMQLFFACQLTGVILVPVDGRSNIETVKNFILQTKPKLFFKGKSISAEFDLKCPIIQIEDLNTLIESCSKRKPKLRLSGNETALIVFTSGTTAAPKGVVLTQKNILTNVEGVKEAIKIEPSWRVLSVLPLSHMYELTGECCMYGAGACIYYLPRIAPLAIAQAMKQYKITTMMAVPQLLALFKQRILQTAASEGRLGVLEKALAVARFLPFKIRRLLFGSVHKKLGGQLKLVITGGAPIPPDVAEFWEMLGVVALQGYGLTETSPILTANRLNRRRPDSQGIKLFNVKLRIAKDGEILAKGPNVFKGYYKNAKQTNKVFTKDGWFKTGDIGKLEGEWLKIQGRAKFAIILPSGLNVFPEDIEATAEQQNLFKEFCIVGLNRPEDEEVHAVIVADKLSDKKIQQKIDKLNNSLEEYQFIKSWSRWPGAQFPRTLLLKVDRRNIQIWANGSKNLDDQTDSKETEIDLLLNLIRLVIDRPNLKIYETDKLSRLGIDSLRRLALVSLIEEQMGLSINENQISEKTAVRDLRVLVKKGNRSVSSVKRPNWQYKILPRFIGNTLRLVLIRPIIRIWVKTKAQGKHNLKTVKQPAIFIFNHVDYTDAGILYNGLPASITNKLAVAAADDLMQKYKSLTLLARLAYAGFNLDRYNQVLPSLEYASELIAQGWSIALAPEGKISLDGKLQQFKPGIGVLAVETGAPVIPVKIKGLHGTFPLGHKLPAKRSSVTLAVGNPITFKNNVSYSQATKLLEAAMADL